MVKKKNSSDKLLETTQLAKKIQQLELALNQSQEKERRALADYQNLLRQTQVERAKFVQLANADLLAAILQPIAHLSLASEHLNDQALTMIVRQLWQGLNSVGLEEIPVLGKKFDLNTMEVVEKKDRAEKVIKVLRSGYYLNGQVIQHAQVVLG